jgi:hypothetical protein
MHRGDQAQNTKGGQFSRGANALNCRGKPRAGQCWPSSRQRRCRCGHNSCCSAASSGSRPPGWSANTRLTWSPYARPEFRGDIRCVRVDARLYHLDTMACGFVVHFAADNDLQVVDEA